MKSLHPDRGIAPALFTLAGVLGLGTNALGQTAELASIVEPAEIDTGYVVNHSNELETVAVFHVSKPGVPWMRLYFSDVELSGDAPEGTGSFLRITSLTDGHYQFLDAKTILEWRRSTAYFNGDLLMVEVVAYPGSGQSRVVLDQVEYGVDPSGEDTICGVDDREPSNDPRAGRLMPIGCTGFLIDDAAGCLVTAGHCISGSVMQFNVPPSTSGGGTVAPPPSDQYAVDFSSRQSTNGGQGNDWGYFGVFPNSTTGLTPKQAQGAVYTLTAPPAWNSSLNVRITGYGVDSGVRNQVQQTHVGPWLSYTGGTLLAYQADTQGGNSGSPVIQEESGVVMGVHTHGGCTTSGTGSNKGTSFSHASFSNAVQNPRGVCVQATPPSCGVVPFTQVRNGSGVNPVCLSVVTEPALGTEFQYEVDTSVVPGGDASLVRARTPGGTVPGPLGEEFLTGRKLWHTYVSGSGVNAHSFDMPSDLEIAGLVGSMQAMIFVGHEPRQLSNAIDFVVGCVQ